jgi:hypothetical protein
LLWIKLLEPDSEIRFLFDVQKAGIENTKSKRAKEALSRTVVEGFSPGAQSEVPVLPMVA